jgi:hypothetical protein
MFFVPFSICVLVMHGSLPEGNDIRSPRPGIRGGKRAIPAFVGIMNDGLLGAFRPAKNITRADIITVSTLDAFVIG